MQDLLTEIQELRETAYRSYKEAELTEDEKGLAYAEGILSGIDMVIDLVNNYTGGK